MSLLPSVIETIKNKPKQTICVAPIDVKMNHDSSFHEILNNSAKQMSVLTGFYHSTTKKYNQEVFKQILHTRIYLSPLRFYDFCKI